MNPSILTVNNNLNISPEKNPEQTGDLRYLFLIRKSGDQNNISFSVVLKNSGNLIINKIWFSAFIGIAKTNFAPGLDEQESFYIKSSNLGGGSYLSGHTKDFFKLPPETILEILYFDIPKDKLIDQGSLEFYFGCESVKKVSFVASWQKEEIKNALKEINAQNFINFLKYKNQKTCFEIVWVLAKKLFKESKRFLKKVKNWFIKDTNF